METCRFTDTPEGTLFRLLSDAYSPFPELVASDAVKWREFDSFVYASLSFINECGFVSMEDGEPIGFISWDPRKLPCSVEVGHNCIRKSHKGMGKGREQLAAAVERIRARDPEMIIVKTGNVPFFVPAQRMYESVGFKRHAVTKTEGGPVPEVIEYRIQLK